MSERHGQRRAALVSRPIAAAESIGRRIVSGSLKPGSVLPSFDRLADEFSVSRLSVREAMRALAAKGLVDSRPRRGTIVRPRSEWSRLDPDVLAWQIGDVPNAAFVRSLFEARAIIEPEAAALVARPRDGGGAWPRSSAPSRGWRDASAVARIDRGRRCLPSGDPDRHRQRFYRRVRAGDRDLADGGLQRAARRRPRPERSSCRSTAPFSRPSSAAMRTAPAPPSAPF